mmetsp:Transcript_20184/g.45548  ORF Transcript_20184/g.45548 Transcript_20184/m.45548 type:complete len:90 (-) Transcript_20184:16-285(-)
MRGRGLARDETSTEFVKTEQISILTKTTRPSLQADLTSIERDGVVSANEETHPSLWHQEEGGQFHGKASKRLRISKDTISLSPPCILYR